MLRNRFLAITSLLAATLLASACDSSRGSLISGDIKNLLDPNALTDETGDSTSNSDDTSDSSNDNNARVSGDTHVNGANALTPIVNSVSSTITIRGADIVLLIQGSNLPDSLQVNLDNDSSSCQVSQLLTVNSNSNLANTLEAVCTTSAITNRQVFVRSATGIEIQGSPLDFSATNITVDSSDTRNSSNTSNTEGDLQTATNEPTATPPVSTSPADQDNEPIAGLRELAQTFIDAPSNIRLLEANASIHLTWDAVGSVEGYNIYASQSPAPQPGASGVTTYTSTQPAIEITDVEVGEKYYVAVSAYFNNNESQRSADFMVQVAAAKQSKYGALFEISGTVSLQAETRISTSAAPTRFLDQSADGRYTVFLSHSDNLVSKALRGFDQVFLHDKEHDQITLISQSASGEPANRHTSSPQISDDGSIVVFVSAASNLDRSVQTSGSTTQLFMANTQTAAVNLISASALNANRAANSNSFAPVIDNNGTNVVFSSQADDLTTSTKTQRSHLYHYNASSSSLTKLDTHRDSAPASLTTTVQADAISPDGNYLFYQLNIPGTSPSLHRLKLQESVQENLAFDETINLGGAYVHSISNDANTALISYDDSTRTALYSLTEKSLVKLGGSSNSVAKGLSGDGSVAIVWSNEDLQLNNAITPSGDGNHYIVNTNTGYVKESVLDIQSISNDGLVFLYTTQSDSQATQLQSIQH
ncbi:MAG: hypothetical protein AB8B84_03215 [Granulosicoccus sp.]